MGIALLSHIMVQTLKTLLWRCLAVTALLLALIGVFLPVMPTVPFVLLAAWAASKGWPQLETWLLEHERFGPHIRAWRQHGAVTRRGKRLATCAMIFSAILMQLIPLPDWGLWARWAVPLIFACVLIWLWRRPEPGATLSETQQ
jgi:hypothetical protein